MKPTQQEIIELARELRRIANPNESRIYQHERGKLFEAARMLERFGTGGGGPVVWMAYTLDGKSVCVTDNPADFTDEHKALPLYATLQPETAQRELVAWLHKGGHVQVRTHYLPAEAIKSYSTNGQWQPPSTPTPPPTDLRAEYLRGLEDAAKVCDERAQGLLSIIDLPVVSSPIIQKDRAAQWKDAATKIRELKGKQ